MQNSCGISQWDVICAQGTQESGGGLVCGAVQGYGWDD